MAKRSPGKTVVVKKKWVSIKAPKIFNHANLGETYVADPAKAVGRRMRVSLAQVTGEHQKQHTLVGFDVAKLEGSDLHTTLREVKMTNSSVKRSVRRNRTKVTDSFLVRTKNDKKIRCKPLIVTRNRVNNSITTALKKSARDTIARAAKKSDFDELCQEVISHKLQRSMSDKLKKIYPLSTCEIRWIKIEDNVKV